MIKRTGYIFFSLAAIIILLHNVTPHFHQESVSSTTVSVTLNPTWSLLAGIFNTDIGDNHLEYFSKYKVDFSEKLTIPMVPAIIPLVAWLDLSEKVSDAFSQSVFVYLIDYQGIDYHSCQVDRGPPTTV